MHRYRPKGWQGTAVCRGDGKVGGVSIHICGPSHDDRASGEEDKMTAMGWRAPSYSCSGPKTVRGRPGWHSPLWEAVSG